MNINRLQLLRDTIASAPEEQFDMTHFFGRSCGTTACIAGFAASLSWGKTLHEAAERDCTSSVMEVQNVAAAWLGLEWKDAHELFLADEAPKWYSEITRTEALRCLNHLIATGEVDWTRAINGGNNA